MILIRLRGVLTPAERQLARTGDYRDGKGLIKQVRIQLLEKAKPLLETLIQDITGRKVQSLHTDISTVTGERVIIFALDGTRISATRPTEALLGANVRGPKGERKAISC